ncbi:MAG TPA: citrate/2-methylcitrate synthase [Candidatus Acidoferrales bacterium]|nr:citrate/2-methylcitrate synthase [Candidatus Acidoferrales bacterium]
MPTVVDRGLEGVVVGSTQLSNVEGGIGRLTYRGYDIDDLAPNATFEEVVHLLLYGHLPNRSELETLKRELGSRRSLPEPLVAAMQNVPKTAWPMDVLRTIVSGLSLFSPVNAHGEHLSDVHTAIELIAKMPTIVAAWDRIRRGLEPIAPRADLSQAGNFLYMRSGKVPHEIEEDALDTYFVLLADHSYNASTFAARVAASTRSDVYASVTAALATLQGDLHGGAASASYHTLTEVRTPERAEQYVRDALDRRERIMGMGHREYKVRDPRARHLEAMARKLSQHVGNSRWYDTAHALEEASRKVLQEKKPDNTIYANVDFYTAPVLADLDVPGDEFTCLFACGRIAGWTGHILEQLADNRLIRPQATYEGPQTGPFVPIEKRAANGVRSA